MKKENKRKIILAALALVSLGMVAIVNFTDVCNLQAVTLNGHEVPDWQERYPLSGDKLFFRQPLDSVSKDLLSNDSIVQVDFDFDMPGTLNIRTNAFEPFCFVLDASSGRMRGLNQQGRIIRLENNITDWEHPILTSLEADRLYDFCDDPRVALLLPQLKRLMSDNRELYRTIEEIDFKAEDRLTVWISGLPYRLIVSAEEFYGQINEFVSFLEQFDTDQSKTRTIDLRNENMIVAKGAR